MEVDDCINLYCNYFKKITVQNREYLFEDEF
jgi:hypothetical protein